jgi:endoglucanase
LRAVSRQGSGGNFQNDSDVFATGKGRTNAVHRQNPTKSGILGSNIAIHGHLWTGLSQDEIQDFRRILSCINGMATFMDQYATPPEVKDASGHASQPNGSIGFTAALLPYLQIQHRPSTVEAQRVRLAPHGDEASGYMARTPATIAKIQRCRSGLERQRLAFDSDGKLRVRWKHAH